MKKDQIIGIHQPNFFPWLGLFHRIAHSDLFVYLDHVHMMPRSSWFTRVNILNQRLPAWLSIPVASWGKNGFPAINEVRLASDHLFKKKHLRTIYHNYQCHPFFPEVFPLVEQYYEMREPLLAKRNKAFIDSICCALNISTPRYLSSDLGCKTAGTDLIVEVVQKAGGQIFLCGGGSSGYLEPEKFLRGGLKLIYQNFQHPEYPQKDCHGFTPGLSIIDVLMNCGFQTTQALMKAKE